MYRNVSRSEAGSKLIGKGNMSREAPKAGVYHSVILIFLNKKGFLGKSFPMKEGTSVI